MRTTRINVSKYIGYFIIMILLSLAGFKQEINAVHTGFYVALIFANENPLITSILYILAGVIIKPTLYTLIISALPSFMMCLTRVLCDHFKRRMSLLLTTIITFLSLIPILVIGVLDNKNLINALITIILTAIFTYLSIIAVFALIVKKLRFKLSTDEMASFLVLLSVISMGIYNINIYGFRIYYTILMLAILLSVSIFELAPALSICFAIGLGGGIMSNSLELAGITILITLVAYTFIHYNRYFAVVSLIALDVACGLYFGAYETYDYYHVIAVLIASIIYILIPLKYIRYYRKIYCNSTKSTALVAYVNRNRIDVNAKINNLALLFTDIEEEMTKGEYIMTESKWKNTLSERVMCEICGKCPNKETCFKALGGDTLTQINPLIEKALIEEVKIDDIGTFLQSRCNKAYEIVDMSNVLAKKYVKTKTHIYDILDNKRILGEEIGSVGKVLSNMSKSILEDVNIDSDLEKRIEEELNILGVVCHDVLVVQGRNSEIEITIVVRNCDKNKRIIRHTLEDLLRLKLDRLEDRLSEVEGFSTIRFVPRARFMITYGVSSVAKEGQEKSGDSQSIIKLDNKRVAVALCDGKGSGPLAHSNSNNTMGIVEKMYKAGFDSDIILSYANRLLSIRNSEDFAALDMCIIDLKGGEADFIKLGGVASFVKRANSIDIVEGSALPMGVLEEAKPSTARRVLSDGDIVLIVSDGMTDSLGSDKIANLLLNNNTENVQTLADYFVECATNKGAIDDTTVIALKIAKV